MVPDTLSLRVSGMMDTPPILLSNKKRGAFRF